MAVGMTKTTIEVLKAAAAVDIPHAPAMTTTIASAAKREDRAADVARQKCRNATSTDNLPGMAAADALRGTTMTTMTADHHAAAVEATRPAKLALVAAMMTTTVIPPVAAADPHPARAMTTTIGSAAKKAARLAAVTRRTCRSATNTASSRVTAAAAVADAARAMTTTMTIAVAAGVDLAAAADIRLARATTTTIAAHRVAAAAEITPIPPDDITHVIPTNAPRKGARAADNIRTAAAGRRAAIDCVALHPSLGSAIKGLRAKHAICRSPFSRNTIEAHQTCGP